MSERTRLEGIRERDANRDPLIAKAEHDAKNRNGTRERSAQRRQLLAVFYAAERDRRWLLERVDELERALRDAIAMDACRHTSGGVSDTYETIIARRHAALAALHAKETPRG